MYWIILGIILEVSNLQYLHPAETAQPLCLFMRDFGRFVLQLCLQYPIPVLLLAAMARGHETETREI